MEGFDYCEAVCRLCFIITPANSVATTVAMPTGMLPSIRITPREIKKVTATIAAPKNLVLVNTRSKPPISCTNP